MQTFLFKIFSFHYYAAKKYLPKLMNCILHLIFSQGEICQYKFQHQLGFTLKPYSFQLMNQFHF